MNMATVARKIVLATLVTACAALGALVPNWSYALYQLGYYDEAKQAAKLASDWESRAHQLLSVQTKCGELSFVVCSITATIEHALASKLAEAYDALANDPPDADFANVAIPEVGASTGRLPELSRPLIAAWRALFANEARTAALLEAFVTANERGQGAAIAQDAAWTQTHAQFAALYASELARLADRHADLAQAAIARWYDEGLPPVSLGDGQVYPDLLAGADISLRTRQFAQSMGKLAGGNLKRVEIDLDVDTEASDDKALVDAASRGHADAVRVVIEAVDDFDVGAIDPSSLRFGPRLAAAIGGGSRHGVRLSGERTNLVLRFSAAAASFECGDDVVTIVGKTWDGQPIGGLAYLAPGSCASDAQRDR